MRIELPVKYSQFDPAYCNHLLGANTDPKYNFYNYGCLICSIANVLRYFGIQTDPLDLNNKLLAVGGFTNGGLYVHGSVSKIYPQIVEKYVATPQALTNEQVADIKIALNNKQPVIFGLDYNPKTIAPDYHFSTVVDYNPNEENDFTLADPLGGRVHSLKNYLGWFKPSARNSIESYFIYSDSSKVAPEQPAAPIVVTNPVIEPVTPVPVTVTTPEPAVLEQPAAPQVVITPNVPIDGNNVDFLAIKANATKWEEIVGYLELEKTADATTTENVRRVIAGIKSRQTDLDKQRVEALKEVETQKITIKNLQDQVSRMKNQVTQSEKLHKAEILNLKQSQPNFDRLTTQYQSVIKDVQTELEAKITELSGLRVEAAHKDIEETVAHEELLTTTPQLHPVTKLLNFLFRVRI